MEKIGEEMENKVRGYINENRMIESGDVVLAGVSGGGDSMTMLKLLKGFQREYGFFLKVIHVHHGIRGAEADRDREFVENICREWEIPCQAYRYDVPALSLKYKMGHEETGRLVRKEAFAAEQKSFEAQGKRVRIALAHNRDDLAETMLHNLSRGSGLRGLAAMRPVAAEIIRPVLCLGRKEIDHYLEEKQIPFIQDSTNLTDEYTRNRIRHHILPLMEQEINQRASEHMAEMAGIAAQAEDYLQSEGRRLLVQCGDEAEGYVLADMFWEQAEILKSYAVMEAFARLAHKRKDFTFTHVKNVLEMEKRQTGSYISLPYNLMAEKRYEGVWIGVKGDEEMWKSRQKNPASVDKAQNISVPGSVSYGNGILKAEIFPYEGQKIEEKPYTKWFDYDKIESNLCIRTRNTGDYLVVNDQGNRKKVNRYMIDEKIPAKLRDEIPLVACGPEVMWMVGYRINARYKITPGTRTVLELEYQGGHLNE